MLSISAMVVKARNLAIATGLKAREMKRAGKRKAAFLASQPEIKMLLIAKGGLTLIAAELFFIGLPASALAESTWPYTFTASGVLTLAWGFYAAFSLKREADAQPSLWSRVKTA